MMPNNVMDVIKGIVGELKEIANARTVVGEPVTVGTKTVIPVVKISVGFGAGGGEGEKQKDGSGYGAGGGGGCIVEPAAFIIMDETGISLLPSKPGKIDSVIEAIPGVVNKLMGMKDKIKTTAEGRKKKSESNAESDDSETD
jgi:uncharacterized spore protein YtfJ